jgi:serine/threonine protein kinase
VAVTLDQFTEHLTESGLISADELDAFQASLPNLATDGESLAKHLVRAGKLTKYQATAVYQGKIKHLKFGDYIVEDTIGKGGMGRVLKARHCHMKRTVALKVLAPHLMNNKRAVQRFYRELEIAGQLSHPNIVTAHDAGEDHGVHYLVMEYVDGQDLAIVLRERGRIPVDQAIDYMLQAAHGLKYAHDQGVIHRDIKPGNLFLNKQGVVKILDMGLARLTLLDLVNVPGDAGLTKLGQVLGTADYLAPEQAMDARIADERSDIYSLGCTLYRLITGKPPYEGETFMLKVKAHEQAAIPSLFVERPDVAERLDATFKKMVAKLPDDRPQTMAAVVDALHFCSKAVSSAPPVPDPGKEIRVPMPSRPAAVVDKPIVKRPLPPQQIKNLDVGDLPKNTNKVASQMANAAARPVVEWYYKVMGEEVGPISSIELARLKTFGELGPFTHVRQGADGEWVAMMRVERLLDKEASSGPSDTINIEDTQTSCADRPDRRPQRSKFKSSRSKAIRKPLAAAWMVVGGAALILLLVSGFILRRAFDAGDSKQKSITNVEQTDPEQHKEDQSFDPSRRTVLTPVELQERLNDFEPKTRATQIAFTWPPSLQPRPSSLQINIDSYLPPLNTEQAIKLGECYTFCHTLSLIADRIHSPASLATRATQAMLQFNRRFRPSVEQIDNILSRELPDWQSTKDGLNAKASAFLTDRVDGQTAMMIVTNLESYAAGNVPSPHLETLLTYQPDFIRQPNRELLAGYKNVYTTDGSGKSQGVKLSIKYPKSWKATPARMPHVVQFLKSQNGIGFETMGISVANVSEFMPGNVKDDDILELMDDKEFWQTGSSKVLNTGAARIANDKPAIWAEVSTRRQRGGIDLETYSVRFAFLESKKLVIVEFLASGLPGMPTARNRFARSAPLFYLMMTSLLILNPYSQP